MCSWRRRRAFTKKLIPWKHRLARSRQGSNKYYKEHYKEFFFTYCSFLSIVAKCKERESLPITCQSFHRKAVYFTELNVLLKQPIRIMYPFNRNREARLQGNRSARDEVGSQLFGSVSLQVSLENLNSNKSSLAGLSCKNKEWGLFLISGLLWMKYFEL